MNKRWSFTVSYRDRVPPKNCTDADYILVQTAIIKARITDDEEPTRRAPMIESAVQAGRAELQNCRR
jgi:hypothetical protein